LTRSTIDVIATKGANTPNTIKIARIIPIISFSHLLLSLTKKCRTTLNEVDSYMLNIHWTSSISDADNMRFYYIFKSMKVLARQFKEDKEIVE